MKGWKAGLRIGNWKVEHWKITGRVIGAVDPFREAKGAVGILKNRNPGNQSGGIMLQHGLIELAGLKNHQAFFVHVVTVLEN